MAYPPPNNPNGVYPPPSNPNGGAYPPPNTNWNAAGANGGTATGYPYLAPPQQHQYSAAPFYQQPQQQYYPAGHAYGDGGSSTFLRKLCSMIIILFIIAGTVVFIVWLVLRPRLPEFRVDSLTVSNFTVNGNSISATWDVNLTAKNPNSKISFSYDAPQAGVFFEHIDLVDIFLQPFDQETKNETQLKASFTATNKSLEASIIDDIKNRRDKGSVDFNIRMVAPMAFEAAVWRPRRRRLKVFCGDLSVSLASNSAKGSLIDAPKKCRVGF